MQLQAIEDRNLTPESRNLLLEMIKLQKVHQEKIDKMQQKFDCEFDEIIENGTDIF